MTRSFSLLTALLLAVSVPFSTFGAEEAADKPAAATIDAAATISTVQDIDYDSRKVTLRDPEGNLTTFVAGEEVRNLDQVNKGDIVLMEYYQGFAYVVEPKEAAVRQRIDTTAVGRADEGEKPGATITDTVDIIASVEEIDQDARMVTLKGANRTVTLKVSDDVDLSEVEVGDEVHANFVESFAVSVLPSPEVSGTVDIESKAVAIGIGFQWGGGTLTMYDGSTHEFKLKGLSIVDIGISKVNATGEVYKLTDPQDFAGTYFAGQAGGALGGGGATVVMKNKKGVVMRLQSKQKGVRLTLAPEGISVQLAEE
jgi:Cu/Ag efflux protein CusF